MRCRQALSYYRSVTNTSRQYSAYTISRHGAEWIACAQKTCNQRFSCIPEGKVGEWCKYSPIEPSLDVECTDEANTKEFQRTKLSEGLSSLGPLGPGTDCDILRLRARYSKWHRNGDMNFDCFVLELSLRVKFQRG